MCAPAFQARIVLLRSFFNVDPDALSKRAEAMQSAYRKFPRFSWEPEHHERSLRDALKHARWFACKRLSELAEHLRPQADDLVIAVFIAPLDKDVGGYRLYEKLILKAISVRAWASLIEPHSDGLTHSNLLLRMNLNQLACLEKIIFEINLQQGFQVCKLSRPSDLTNWSRPGKLPGLVGYCGKNALNLDRILFFKIWLAGRRWIRISAKSKRSPSPYGFIPANQHPDSPLKSTPPLDIDDIASAEARLLRNAEQDEERRVDEERQMSEYRAEKDRIATQCRATAARAREKKRSDKRRIADKIAAERAAEAARRALPPPPVKPIDPAWSEEAAALFPAIYGQFSLRWLEDSSPAFVDAVFDAHSRRDLDTLGLLNAMREAEVAESAHLSEIERQKPQKLVKMYRGRYHALTESFRGRRMNADVVAIAVEIDQAMRDRDHVKLEKYCIDADESNECSIRYRPSEIREISIEIEKLLFTFNGRVDTSRKQLERLLRELSVHEHVLKLALVHIQKTRYEAHLRHVAQIVGNAEFAQQMEARIYTLNRAISHHKKATAQGRWLRENMSEGKISRIDEMCKAPDLRRDKTRAQHGSVDMPEGKKLVAHSSEIGAREISPPIRAAELRAAAERGLIDMEAEF